MTINVKVSNAWKAVSAVSVKVGGTWKEVFGIWNKVDGVWKLSFGTGSAPSTLNATVQNPIVSGSRSGGGVVESSAAVGLPTGGTPPYTHQWTKISGVYTFVITSPTSASSTFSVTIDNGASLSVPHRYTVTDSLGDTASADQQVNLVSTYLPPDPPPLTASISPVIQTASTNPTTGEATANVTADLSGSLAPGVSIISYDFSGTGWFATLGNQAQYRRTLPSPTNQTLGIAVNIRFSNGSSRSASALINWERS